jgi:hypothetical protein
MKRNIIIISSLLFLFSCKPSTEKYSYIETYISALGEKCTSEVAIEAISDSAAIVQAYNIYFTSKRVLYQTGKELDDTLKVPDRAVDFQLKKMKSGENIKNKNFLNKQSILSSLYSEIAGPSYSQYMKRIEFLRISQEKHREKASKAIKLTSYYLSSPNSASGVSAYVYYKNLSDKPIKYFYWEGYPINAVGDQVSCDIRRNSLFRGKDTGPVKKGQSGGGCWDCAWYNWEAKKLIITAVEIDYIDGTNLRIEGDDLYVIGKKK